MTAVELPFGKQGWDYNRTPNMIGKNVVITGGNSGIGFEAAKVLVSKNAHVTIFCRNEEKARAAVAQIAQSATPEATIDYVLMDLADLSSVRNAAGTYLRNHQKLDVLLNNAGLMMIWEQ